MNFFAWIGSFFRKKPEKMSDRAVEREYLAAGKIFGDAVSYLYMGECVGFEEMLDDVAMWEREYARRGYGTFSIDDFVSYGGYGTPIQGVGKKRPEGVEPTLHAERYRTKYLGKVSPAINLAAVMQGQAQVGEFVMPTTKDPPTEDHPYRDAK